MVLSFSKGSLFGSSFFAVLTSICVACFLILGIATVLLSAALDSGNDIAAFTLGMGRRSLNCGFGVSNAIAGFSTAVFSAKKDLNKLDLMLNGNSAKGEIGARTPPTVRGRMFIGYRGLMTTYGPTPTHKKSVADAKTELKTIQSALSDIVDSVLPKLESSLKSVGAPMIEGQMRENRN